MQQAAELVDEPLYVREQRQHLAGRDGFVAIAFGEVAAALFRPGLQLLMLTERALEVSPGRGIIRAGGIIPDHHTIPKACL